MPAVFISYEWDKSVQVKALYQRLTEVGCKCWLDVFHLGGGDPLSDIIDQGIRDSDVIILCITEKFLKSANCTYARLNLTY